MPVCLRGVNNGTARVREINHDGYWTKPCQGCALKGRCTTGKERRISRWEHEAGALERSELCRYCWKLRKSNDAENLVKMDF
jgi:hypothetical protein